MKSTSATISPTIIIRQSVFTADGSEAIVLCFVSLPGRIYSAMEGSESTNLFLFNYHVTIERKAVLLLG